MRSRTLATGLAALCLSLLLAAPASAQPSSSAAAAQVANPNCTASNQWILYGAQFLNGATVNGTWYVWTIVSCPGGNTGDIALSVALDRGTTRITSAATGFTGMPHSAAAVIAYQFCAQCNGTYTLTWTEILKAPAGFLFASGQPAGCATILGGTYLGCVVQKVVTI